MTSRYIGIGQNGRYPRADAGNEFCLIVYRRRWWCPNSCLYGVPQWQILAQLWSLADFETFDPSIFIFISFPPFRLVIYHMHLGGKRIPIDQKGPIGRPLLRNPLLVDRLSTACTVIRNQPTMAPSAAHSAQSKSVSWTVSSGVLVLFFVNRVVILFPEFDLFACFFSLW